jgi:hypothetical protein
MQSCTRNISVYTMQGIIEKEVEEWSKDQRKIVDALLCKQNKKEKELEDLQKQIETEQSKLKELLLTCPHNTKLTWVRVGAILDKYGYAIVSSKLAKCPSDLKDVLQYNCIYSKDIEILKYDEGERHMVGRNYEGIEWDANSDLYVNGYRKINKINVTELMVQSCMEEIRRNMIPQDVQELGSEGRVYRIRIASAVLLSRSTMEIITEEDRSIPEEPKAASDVYIYSLENFGEFDWKKI